MAHLSAAFSALPLDLPNSLLTLANHLLRGRTK
jgi:hypothetical protein